MAYPVSTLYLREDRIFRFVHDLYMTILIQFQCQPNGQVWMDLFFIAVEKDEVVMHHNQAYETVTRMNHSRPVTEVPTEPCPAYGVVGSYHE